MRISLQTTLIRLLRLTNAIERLAAAMENDTSNDVWNNVTSSPSDPSLKIANIRDLALKVVYLIIGTVGVLDNLFVLVVFILFIKITDKVL